MVTVLAGSSVSKPGSGEVNVSESKSSPGPLARPLLWQSASRFFKGLNLITARQATGGDAEMLDTPSPGLAGGRSRAAREPSSKHL